MAAKGRPMASEMKLKLLLANTGRKCSAETKAKISAALKGRVMSPEWRAKLGEANKKRKMSPENKAKLMLANTGRECSPETRAKISAANMGRVSPNQGKHLSDDTKAKLSKAHLGKPGLAGDKNPMHGKHEDHPWFGRHHTDGTKAKIAAALKGKIQSAETRARKSLAGKGRVVSRETREKLSQAMKGKQVRGTGWKHSEETKDKMRISGIGKNKGKHHTPESKAKLSKALKGKRCGEQNPMYKKEVSLATRIKISEAIKKRGHPMLGKHCSEITKDKISIAEIGKKLSDEAKAKISAISKRCWANLEWAERNIKASHRSQRRKQTKPEKMLEVILGEILPNEYKYVGSSGEVVIAGVLPDFINVNGKKKIIESFGDWWHGEKRTGKTKEQVEAERIMGFKGYGFSCLILWENEIKNEYRRDELVNRILAFNAGEPIKPM